MLIQELFFLKGGEVCFRVRSTNPSVWAIVRVLIPQESETSCHSLKSRARIDRNNDEVLEQLHSTFHEMYLEVWYLPSLYNAIPQRQ
jgi:hypothetical protein